MDTYYRFNGYEIIEELGVGTTATVYKARDLNLQRLVALKVIHKELARNKAFLERFYREARIIATIEHPAIVKIYHINPDGETPYLVEELVEGSDLKTIIEQRSPIFPDEIALFILKKIASGLAEVHKRGIVHRDLKPENILISKDGKIKIVDFGLAHLPGVERLTQWGTLIGTLGYASPEQIRGEEITPASDIFSLGIVFYEMITSRHPFSRTGDKRSELPALINSILKEKPMPPSKFDKAISPSVEKIILKMLEKDQSLRYKNAEELYNHIDGYLNKTGVDWEKWYSLWINDDSANDEKENLISFLIYQLMISDNPIDREEIIAKVEKLGYKITYLEKVFLKLRKPLITFLLILVFVVVFFLFPSTLNKYSHYFKLPRFSVESSEIKHNSVLNKNKRKVKKKSKKLAANKPKLYKTKLNSNGKKQTTKMKKVQENIQPGYIRIITYPWAEVYIDGKYVGKTPFLKFVKLIPGKHKIELKNPYTYPVTQWVVVNPNKITESRARLEFLPSYIKITGGPFDKIILNGKEIKYNGEWISCSREVELITVKDGKKKECTIKLLPGQRKKVLCSP